MTVNNNITTPSQDKKIDEYAENIFYSPVLPHSIKKNSKSIQPVHENNSNNNEIVFISTSIQENEKKMNLSSPSPPPANSSPSRKNIYLSFPDDEISIKIK